ncbi:hypothetical protein [Curtobacterium flaccumfaciens]|uniref:hypothetical protein n=1 Tax=Curtobacterium flaccumfaciens TaxID=2035 RepID=UPI00387A732B
MTSGPELPQSYLERFARPTPQTPAPGPSTTITATIETMDNDRAFASDLGIGLPIP